MPSKESNFNLCLTLGEGWGEEKRPKMLRPANLVDSHLAGCDFMRAIYFRGLAAYLK